MGGSRVSLPVGGLAPPLTRYRAKPDCARLPNEPDCRIGQMSGWGFVPRWGTIGHMVPLRRGLCICAQTQGFVPYTSSGCPIPPIKFFNRVCCNPFCFPPSLQLPHMFAAPYLPVPPYSEPYAEDVELYNIYTGLFLTHHSAPPGVPALLQSYVHDMMNVMTFFSLPRF